MKTIEYNMLRKKMDEKDDFLLVNVLSHSAFKESHIKGSVNIPLEEPDFAKRVEKKVGSKGHDIVTYCASYDCRASHDAAEKLTKAGFNNVRVYEGGMKEWSEKQKAKAA